MHVQMLGLCRFSYAGLGGHQIAHQTIEERKAVLYDPQRLQRRWNWFEQVALPCLIGQTDPDYRLVVMACPDLPQPYLGWLRDIAAEVPAIRLSLIEPQPRYLAACSQAIAPHIDPKADVIGHFRHDDDDAVAFDYIASGKEDFRSLEDLWQRKQRLACDYAMGVVGHVQPSGLRLENRFISHATAALTIYLPASDPRSAIHFEHWKIASMMPTVTLAYRRMYFRLMHQDNDSQTVGAGYALEDEGINFENVLRRRFGIELSALNALAQEGGDKSV
ncbi:glycosyltransferase [Paracoccus sp. (in: a-proteobacteria)]|uniref:glycosyltransferase n=1 Tax=Paracoccus sp. TaxID=267 RepID=UPI002897C0B4|nr:glycosyltransferase [Paracoccus sp. (in: a-proteobacteria)]